MFRVSDNPVLHANQFNRFDQLLKSGLTIASGKKIGHNNYMAQRKKNLFRILLGLLAFFVLSILFAPAIFELIGKWQAPEMTPEKAQRFFREAGGINEVNREAKILIDEFGTNDFPFLFPQDLSNSPAILSLYSTCESYSGFKYTGTSVGIFPQNGKHIEIKFGNHWVLKRFCIFDPSAPVTFNSPLNWFQVSSNIFASR